ncbi:MAG: hypothetical protein ACO2O4_03225 [Minisyncoccia bacterium]|jgi:hypothetical protein
MDINKLQQLSNELKNRILKDKSNLVDIVIKKENSILTSMYEPVAKTVIVGAKEVLEGKENKDKLLSSYFTVLGHELGHAKRDLEGKWSSRFYAYSPVIAFLSHIILHSYNDPLSHFLSITSIPAGFVPMLVEEYKAHKDVENDVKKFLKEKFGNEVKYSNRLRNAAFGSYLSYVALATLGAEAIHHLPSLFHQLTSNTN